MVVRPEDKNKIIGLSIGIVAMAVWIFVFILPQLKGNSPAPTPTNPTAPTGSNTVSPPTGSALQPGGAGTPLPTQLAQNAAQAVSFPEIGPGMGVPPSSSRDPFKPVVDPKKLNSSNNPPLVRPNPPVRPVNNNPGPSLPPMNANPGSFLVRPGGGAINPVFVAPPVPTIELKGVIPGDPGVAVLAVAGQSKFVRVGEKVAEGVALKKITDSGVELSIRGERETLGVGRSTGGGNSAPAAPQSPSQAYPLTDTRTQAIPNSVTSVPDVESSSAPKPKVVVTQPKTRPRSTVRRIRRPAPVVRFSGRRL